MASRLRTIVGPVIAIVALVAGSLAAPAAAQGPDGLAHDRAAQVDDLYAFVSPDRPDTATIITTWGGPQEPGDWASDAWFDPDVSYWIKVDNTGDSVADITWTFRFLTQLDAPESILATGFGSVPGAAATVTQSVNVTRNDQVAHERRHAARQHRPPDHARVRAALAELPGRPRSRTSRSSAPAACSRGSGTTRPSSMRAP